jgi:hypothetical protein
MIRVVCRVISGKIALFAAVGGEICTYAAASMVAFAQSSVLEQMQPKVLPKHFPD